MLRRPSPPLPARAPVAPLVLLPALLLAACAPGDGSDAAPPPPTPEQVAVVGAPATFRGTLPCADCPGIRTTLVLDADGTASVTRLYVEATPDADATAEESGRWTVDEAGRLLVQGEGGDPLYFALDMAGLMALDRTGSPYDSSLPRTLHRVPEGPMAELAGTAWRFVEPAPAADAPQQAALRFDGRRQVTGSDGCNALLGPWRAAEGTLSIGPLAGTVMACAGAVDEAARAIHDAVDATTAYRIDDGELHLLDAEGAPVARLRPAV